MFIPRLDESEMLIPKFSMMLDQERYLTVFRPRDSNTDNKINIVIWKYDATDAFFSDMAECAVIFF